MNLTFEHHNFRFRIFNYSLTDSLNRSTEMNNNHKCCSLEIITTTLINDVA